MSQNIFHTVYLVQDLRIPPLTNQPKFQEREDGHQNLPDEVSNLADRESPIVPLLQSPPNLAKASIAKILDTQESAFDENVADCLFIIHTVIENLLR